MHFNIKITMFGLLSNAIAKLFGSKSDRDIKQLSPIIEAVAQFDASLKSISHDELRAKTISFKKTIAEKLSTFDQEKLQLEANANQLDATEVEKKSAIYDQIDALAKNRDSALEEVLLQIMPEAFAVIKETARRFKDNTTLRVTATDFDKTLAASKDYVKIEGAEAIWQNSWEAAGNRIVWDMLHYDVQLIGGSVLHQGKIAEMATGEGKTLVATLPAYLNALPGLGVHIVTVNDYLARRDSEWMGPIMEFHGLKVDCIDKHQPNSEARRNAYLADITYGTNNEFGFDYLRDNMARNADELVQRKHHYAMVDEVDSVLVDDARTPLIISGPVPKGDIHEFYQLKPRIERLVDVQRKYLNTCLTDAKRLFAENKPEEAGLPLLRAHRGLPKYKPLIKFLSEPGVRALLQKTEAYYMQDQQKEMHKVDAALYFVIEEKQNSVELTEKGIELITAQGEDADFFIMPDVGAKIAEIEKANGTPEEKLRQKESLLADFSVKSERIHTINQLLKAYCLFEKDVEYIVDNNKVKIVDEQTGRVLDGRRYSDGLHQAIEAKEQVKVEAATQTFATVTLQNYFRMYHKLAGMTGTAETEAGELWEIYKLDVVVIPTNKPIVRQDKEDLVYKTTREKYNAIIDEVSQLVQAGRPVLVGTTSVENSELLSRMLKLRGLKHQVLNAKLHQKEADIVAEAGKAGTVTIATNMAGRGTDIKLGPSVKEAGGLAIIGTERHESRRVDRQLRGRAGRQGDPGSSQFFVSLEDNLMRLFGSERIASIMDKFGYKEGEVIQHSMITKSIERAQRKVEENNFGVRKRLLEYDDVMNSQREVIYKKRRNALYGSRLSVDIDSMFGDVAADLADKALNSTFEEVNFDTIRTLGMEFPIQETELKSFKPNQLVDKIHEAAQTHYLQKNKMVAEMAFPVIEQVFLQEGDKYQNIVVPFVFGNKTMQLPVNLKQAYETKCQSLVVEFEKNMILLTIDEAWKDHLREMDELKQSVQNAVYEQKDPLLIYKFESFELFKKMLLNLHREIASILAKAVIPVQEPEQVQQAVEPLPQPKQNQVTASRPSYSSSNTANIPNEIPKPSQLPLKSGPKIGRNDPCPCGSGKKYKACHGQNEE